MLFDAVPVASQRQLSRPPGTKWRHRIPARRLSLLAPTITCVLLGAFTATASAAGSASYFTSIGVGSMMTPAYGLAAAVLPSGDVLTAGGYNSGGYLQSAELFNPSTGTFTATGTMTTSRYSPAAATLANGQVLIAGGMNGGGYLQSAELYDPSTGTFTATGAMTVPRSSAAAATLPNGQVLVAGGDNSSGSLQSAELFNPNTGTFTATSAMATPRAGAAAATLQNGQILIAGGHNSIKGDLQSAELYNPKTGTFTATGSMTAPRESAVATTLPSGQVLIAGGANGSLYLQSAELYNPKTGTFSSTASMTVRRDLAAAVTLTDGRVLIAGGFGSGILQSAELYVPAPQAQVAGGNFGQQTIKHRSADTPITITNIGAQTLTISSLALSGANRADFALTADNCTGAKLAYRQSCTITANFNPQKTGSRTATLTLTDNEPAATTITLKGTGTTAQVELVTCTTKTVKHKTVRKCTGKLVSGPVTFTTTGRVVVAKVMRGHSQVATATISQTTNGRILLRPSHSLKAGDYTLVFRRHIGDRAITVKRQIIID